MSQPTYGYTSGIPFVLPGQRFEGTQFTPALAAAIAARVGQLQDIEVLPDGRLRFTLPNGEQITTEDSARGPAGEDGADGPPNSLTVGTVQTGALAASITGTAPNQTLNLTLPAASELVFPRHVTALSQIGYLQSGHYLLTGSDAPNGNEAGILAMRAGTPEGDALAFIATDDEGVWYRHESDTAWTPLGTAADLAALTGRVTAAEGDIAALQAAPQQLVGTGQPNGRVTAVPGATYLDTAKTAGASVWIKTSGTGNTGWEVTKANTGAVTVVEWDSSGTVTNGNLPANLTPRSGAGFIAFAREGDTASLIIRSADITGAVTIPCPAWARPVTNARTTLAHNDGTAMVSVGTNVIVVHSGLTRAINPISAVATWPLFGTPWPTSL